MLAGSHEVIAEVDKLATSTEDIAKAMTDMASGIIKIQEAVNTTSSLTQENIESFKELDSQLSNIKTKSV